MNSVARHLSRIALAGSALLMLAGCVYEQPRSGVVYDDDVRGGAYYDDGPGYYSGGPYYSGYYGPAYYGPSYNPWWGWPIGLSLGYSYYGGHHGGYRHGGSHHGGGHHRGH